MVLPNPVPKLSDSKKTCRILAFVEHYPPFLGSDRSVFELAKRAAQKGKKIHFVATQPLRYLVGQRPPDWEYTKNWDGPVPKTHENISAKYLLSSNTLLKVWKIFPPLALLLTLLSFTISSIREINRFKPQVVVVAHASPIVGVVGVLSAKLSRRPIVMGCPDWMTAYGAELIKGELNTLGRVFLHIIEMTLYKWSDKIFAATTFLQRLLIHHNIPSSKITVIPNGVDAKQFSPEIDASEIRKQYDLFEKSVVIFSGHLEEWAGVSVVYNLAERLHNEVPNARILLVGAGVNLNLLFDRLSENGLSQMVVYAGFHPHDEIPKFTAASDVALCIFPDTAVSHAASPLKLFEYMGSGNAIVATRVAGTAEILHDDVGLLVPPGDSQAICDATILLFLDETRRKELGRHARELVEEKYSWDILSDRFLSVCDSAIV
ncbi:MAG: glycosyltransferase [Candidatus Lokiarchaeota archaeon]|nr:glycosyltransferase [Candidatus Lokiarchaeota archaeon]